MFDTSAAVKTRFNTIVAALFLCVFTAVAQEIDKGITTEEHKAGGDSAKRYFLIRHRLPPNETPKKYGLLLVLPGGAGNADFLPFCANVITEFGTPKDFIMAELIAPVWGKMDDSTVVWPSKAMPGKEAKFTTEAFIESVIEDVSKQIPIHDGWIFTLGWSSSGHAVYSSSFENPKIRGSFVAMSRFQSNWFAHPENARGKRYYFWHSPDDQVCPYAESQAAAAFLTKQGALAVQKSYKGGHGWQPFTFYADRVLEAMEWFRASDADAPKVQKKLNAAR